MDSIRITSDPLDVAAAVQAVTCPEAGGIDVFAGATRAEVHPDLGRLLALDYEAYEPMAAAEIGRLLAQARARWPIVRAAVWHRTGRVAVGAPSVVIAVSTPHRAEAFAACQFLIDELKKSVPIWKKEVYESSSRWKGEVP
jgi:molybdopterin synthase catalytic subunit